MFQSETKTSQVDHVIISLYGIFIIETKAYKGWIYGNEKSMYWTQVIYSKKSKFLNPIIQNAGHCKTLLKVIEDKYVPIIPIVAFSGNCDLKIDISSHVVYFSQVCEVIRSYKKSYFTEVAIKNVSQYIIDFNVTSRKIRKEHVNSIREKVKNNEISISSGKCPQCGKDLVVREGKYGSFTGCSGYPRCRFIKK